jgi:hypothetical protein
MEGSAKEVRWLDSRHMSARSVRAVAAVAVAVAALGVLTSMVGAAAAPDANLVAARAAAQRILSVTPLPPGAVPQSTDPSVGATLSQVYLPRGPQQIASSQYWTASGAPGTVSDYIYSHPPAGSRFYSQEGIGEPSSSSSGWQEERSFPGQIGKVTSELLEITTAPASGGGAAIRADAIVLWRPTWEQVAAGAHAARVRLDGFAQRTVTGAALAGLRSLVNTASVVAPGAYSCPSGFPGQAIGITFVDARGGSLAHVAFDSVDGCGWMAMSVGTQRGPALLGGYGLVPRLWSAGSLIRCTARQLSVSVGAPSLDSSRGDAQLTAHNRARAPCSLRGEPTISLRAASGQTLPVRRARQGGTVTSATAPGHGILAASLSWSSPHRHCGLPSPASATVGLPGIAGRFDVALRPTRARLGPCSGRIETSPFFGVWLPTSRHVRARS